MALQLGGGSGLLGLAPLLFIFAIFYFLLIMPQQRKQKKWQAMLSQLLLANVPMLTDDDCVFLWTIGACA